MFVRASYELFCAYSNYFMTAFLCVCVCTLWICSLCSCLPSNLRISCFPGLGLGLKERYEHVYSMYTSVKENVDCMWKSVSAHAFMCVWKCSVMWIVTVHTCAYAYVCGVFACGVRWGETCVVSPHIRTYIYVRLRSGSSNNLCYVHTHLGMQIFVCV